MNRVLMVSSILALISVVQSVMLLRHVHYQTDMTLASRQTAMFMQLVIAGHLLLFSTRSEGFFFQPPWPEWKFFCAIMGTQVFAAFMAANGWLVTPISWRLIGYIWLFNLAWLFVIDLVKVALYHYYDKQAAGQESWQKQFHAPLNAYGGRLGRPPADGG
jgi:H+-transporting ATPase